MNTIEVDRARKRLDALFARGKSLLGDPELQSHWSRYLCVLISGFLEVSIQTLYTEYAKDKASPRIANFVQAHVTDFKNPNMEKVLNIARSFSPDWADTLETATQDKIKASIDSIVAVRHLIAHGKSVGMSFSNVSQYYGDAVALIELIEEQCKKG